MILIVAKNREVLSLLPVLAGFVTNQLALVTQLVYPEDYGVVRED